MYIFENNAYFFLLIILSFYCVRNYGCIKSPLFFADICLILKLKISFSF